MRTLPSACLVALMASASLAACASDDEVTIVPLTASDDACVAETTDLAAGKTTFRIQNDGNTVTEVYIYADGDRVVTERENIGPGTSAELTANLAAGTYELACKPGMTGDGIRQEITVTGEGGDALLDGGDVEIHFAAIDYTYTGLDDLDLHSGDTVEFEMRNDGTVEHEFEVFGPDGVVLGEVGPTPAGDEGKVVLELTEAGEYRYVCGIDDHEERGMVGTFNVE
ncbi:MAG: cupredoxin domain-containing protein [Acidimicrobiales bacterium]